MMETDIDSSVLGTYDYWNKIYSEEIENFKDHGDVGEIWFGRDTSKKIVKWLSNSLLIQKDDDVLDIGCGNGMLLVDLFKEGFVNLHGIDYSQNAIDLATSVSSSAGCNIKFTVGSILDDEFTSALFSVALDKGTYDAVSLDPENSKTKRQTYIKNVSRLLKAEGLFLITSCNWTEAEVIEQFSSDFIYVETLPSRTLTFGGKKGNTVSSIVFKKR